MALAVCLLSVIPMRKEPSHISEMVSQLLFGEYAETMEEKDDFTRIKCLYDGYEGWAQSSQLKAISDEQTFTAVGFVSSYTSKILINDRVLRVPFATPVYHLQDSGAILNIANQKIQYPEQEIWTLNENSFSKETLETVVRVFLNTPYLWGGKSVFGIDCSGFVQQTFKLFGIPVLRDAYLQAGQGTAVASINEAQLGNLAFFQNESGRVVHVGIILEEGNIAHASGKVRIDKIDVDGIINGETGKRTHRLHSIRRFF